MNIFAAHGLSLRDDATPRLETRPKERRQPGYEDRYDHRTLIYDCFVSGSDLVLVGPPLLNLEKELFPARIFTATRELPHRYYPLDRCYSIHIDTDRLLGNDLPGNRLWLDEAYWSRFTRNRVEIGEGNGLFAGKRVLFTLQKNNPIEWITTWVEFFVKVHGTDAVLIYDNGSDPYTLESLYAALIAIDGLDTLALVDFRYPYGPFGAWFEGDRRISSWDSDFCQYGARESSRKRFLAHSRSVICVDIDELIVPTRSDCGSIHEFAESCGCETVVVEGEFVSNATDRDVLAREPRELRHHDFRHTCLPPLRSNPKCCGVPARSAPDSQWSVHAGGKKRKTQDSFLLRHFRAINTNWKCNRSNPCEIDPKEHMLDTHLDRVSRIVEKKMGSRFS